MNPTLVKHVILPMHELLTGRQTLRNLRLLECSQWWSAERIAALQTEKLMHLLRHAYENVPFYGNLFRKSGVDPCSDDPRRILAGLPLLDKDTIRRHVADMVWHHAPGGLHAYATGGSTGRPLQFYFDRRRQSYDQAARMRTHRWFGVDVGQKEAYLWGAPVELNRQDRLRRVRDGLVNHLLLSAFQMSEANLDRYLDRLEAYQPLSLFGYPSGIAHLVKHARARNRKLRLPQLKAVFVTGEFLQEYHRQAIEEYFGIPVANGYGSREAGFIAHECPAGSMHLTDENVVCELLDEAGHPVPHGHIGEIVITHLDAYAMPFIRYRTGDLARSAAPSPCPCGRGLSRLEGVEGRRTDFLRSADGTLRHALSLIYVLRETPGIEEFRVYQRKNLDIDILLVTARELDDHRTETLRWQVQSRMGPDIAVRLHRVDRIEVEGSGKYRQVISDAAGAC